MAELLVGVGALLGSSHLLYRRQQAAIAEAAKKTGVDAGIVRAVVKEYLCSMKQSERTEEKE